MSTFNPNQALAKLAAESLGVSPSEVSVGLWANSLLQGRLTPYVVVTAVQTSQIKNEEEAKAILSMPSIAQILSISVEDALAKKSLALANSEDVDSDVDF